MAIKTYKPTSKSQRQHTSINYRGLLSGHRPHKPLTKGARSFGGRNSFGRITTRHQGGGHKRTYRDVDFRFTKKNVLARIASIEYDPFRSAFIALAIYQDGDKRYHLVPQRIKVGDTFTVAENAPLALMNRMPLKKVPVGTFVFNIELK